MATDFQQKERLPEITDRIVETYHEIGTVHHLGHCPSQSGRSHRSSPGTERRDLSRLQPSSKPALRQRDLSRRNIVDSLHDILTVQIGRALRHQYVQKHGADCEKLPKIDFEAEGQRKQSSFWK